MDDLEKTRLCAAARGIKEREHPIAPVTPPAIWVEGEGGHCYFYHPLRNDAQAMALGKSDPELFEKCVTEWASMIKCGESDADLNRVLVTEFSRHQAAKEKA